MQAGRVHRVHSQRRADPANFQRPYLVPAKPWQQPDLDSYTPGNIRPRSHTPKRWESQSERCAGYLRAFLPEDVATGAGPRRRFFLLQTAACYILGSRVVPPVSYERCAPTCRLPPSSGTSAMKKGPERVSVFPDWAWVNRVSSAATCLLRRSRQTQYR